MANSLKTNSVGQLQIDDTQGKDKLTAKVSAGITDLLGTSCSDFDIF